MKFVRWSIAGAVFGLMLVGSSPSAGAGIEGTNGCQATGSWRKAGLTIDAATATGVITIPRKDIVDWQGSVAAPPGVYSGSVSVELPPPFGEMEVDSWSGDSQTTSNAGEHEYDLPSLVPAGVEFTVAGEHADENGQCSGSVKVQLEGGAFDSPLTAVSLAGTALTGVGVALALRRLFQTVMNVGLMLGTAVLAFFFLLFVALDLVLFGVLPLNSVVVTVLPIIGLLAGGALSVLAGKHQSTS